MCLGISTWDQEKYSEPPWKEQIFPSLGNHWLTVTLHVGVGLSEISHIHIGMLTGGVALQAFCSQPSDSSFKHTGPNLCLEDSISHQISGSCGS